MAINYTYPVKTSPASSDDILIIDNADSSKATKRIAISTLPISGSGGGTVTDVTASLPLASTGGATPAISLGGLSTLGTSSQIMAINSAGTGLEYVPQQVVEVVEANSTISKGDPLYVSGFNSGTSIAIVDKADASDPNKMPSVGIASDNISLGATGEMKVIGIANSINVNAIPSLGSNPLVNDIIYVASGGGLTSIKPTGTNLIQNVAIVLKASGSGSLQVTAIGRSNDLPNIPQGNIWLGDSNGVPAALTPGANNTVLTSNGTTASWSTTALSNYLPLAGGAMTGPITTNSTFDGVDVAARDAVLTTTTNTANAALPLTGGTMTGPITMSANINMSNTSVDGGGGASSTISNMYSVTGNQIISTPTTLTPSSTMTWDTGTGATLVLDVASSGTSVSTFNVNNLSVGATATIFLNSTVGNSVAPSAWSVLIGGITQTVIWAGGVIPTTPPSAAIRKDKLTFTSNGVDVYGVAHEGFL